MIFALLAFVAGQGLIGEWQFYKMIYQGRQMPPRDENLVLRYQFSEDGQSHLHWYYKNDKNFHCERKGKYRIENEVFIDQVIWVSPKNSPQCSSDPDMQLGKESKVPFEIRNGDLITQIPLNDDFIYYVWKAL